MSGDSPSIIIEDSAVMGHTTPHSVDFVEELSNGQLLNGARGDEYFDVPEIQNSSATTPTPTITPSSSSGNISNHTGYSEGVFGKYKHTDVPKLTSIIFSLFDNTAGSGITFQVPEGCTVVKNETFSCFSGLVIPKDEFLNKLVKITYDNFKLIGHPVGLEHSSYFRGVLMFNMCFVVMKESTVDCMYEPIVQKIAEHLIDLEQECMFISNKEHRHRIPQIMASIFEQLNSKGEAIVEIENTMTTMNLKLCPAYRGQEPPKVALYMVPMLTRNVDVTSAHLIAKMDVLSQKIIPKIDGVRCVKEIACEVDIDADLVSRCVRNLFFYECVSLVPLFLYQNCYVSTEKLHDFYNNQAKIDECLEFVRLRYENSEKGPLPKFSDVYRLYMSLTCGYTMDRWCREINPAKYNVDERRLVQFGMYHKFVRKLSIYPVATISPSEEGKEKIFSLCDGTNALEDLAVIYSTYPSELLEFLKRSGKFEFISK